MRRLTSPGHAQRFLSAFSRHLLARAACWHQLLADVYRSSPVMRMILSRRWRVRTTSAYPAPNGPPRGTCYLGFDELTAIRETVTETPSCRAITSTSVPLAASLSTGAVFRIIRLGVFRLRPVLDCSHSCP